MRTGAKKGWEIAVVLRQTTSLDLESKALVRLKASMTKTKKNAKR